MKQKFDSPINDQSISRKKKEESFSPKKESITEIRVGRAKLTIVNRATTSSTVSILKRHEYPDFLDTNSKTPSIDTWLS